MMSVCGIRRGMQTINAHNVELSSLVELLEGRVKSHQAQLTAGERSVLELTQRLEHSQGTATTLSAQLAATAQELDAMKKTAAATAATADDRRAAHELKLQADALSSQLRSAQTKLTATEERLGAVSLQSKVHELRVTELTEEMQKAQADHAAQRDKLRADMSAKEDLVQQLMTELAQHRSSRARRDSQTSLSGVPARSLSGSSLPAGSVEHAADSRRSEDVKQAELKQDTLAAESLASDQLQLSRIQLDDTRQQLSQARDELQQLTDRWAAKNAQLTTVIKTQAEHAGELRDALANKVCSCC